MFIYPAVLPETKAPRKGISLLMVISMLALFAVVALGFLYYAQSVATAARYAREAKLKPRPDSSTAWPPKA